MRTSTRIHSSRFETNPKLRPFPGVYTGESHVHGHEITIPRKVSNRGELVSHNVTHHHHEDGPVVHYRLSVAGNEYHIELAAVDKFIGPGMVVERRKRNVHVRARPKNTSSKCHYRGFIRGHPNSRVALSACDGLVSFTPSPLPFSLSLYPPSFHRLFRLLFPLIDWIDGFLDFSRQTLRLDIYNMLKICATREDSDHIGFL